MRDRHLSLGAANWWEDLDLEEKLKHSRIYHSTENLSELSNFDIEELYDDYLLSEKLRHEKLIDEWKEWEEIMDEEDYFDDEDWP